MAPDLICFLHARRVVPLVNLASPMAGFVAFFGVTKDEVSFGDRVAATFAALSVGVMTDCLVNMELEAGLSIDESLGLRTEVGVAPP